MERHPLNAPGPFYVANGACITCRLPEHCAPTLMGFYDDPSHQGKSHCFFKNQPSNPRELEQAIDAVGSSCCWALRYDGDDPAVLAQFQTKDLARLCDQLPEGKEPL